MNGMSTALALHSMTFEVSGVLDGIHFKKDWKEGNICLYSTLCGVRIR
jgi:hypothetical protein